jgi:hypothetical protein
MLSDWLQERAVNLDLLLACLEHHDVGDEAGGDAITIGFKRTEAFTVTNDVSELSQ